MIDFEFEENLEDDSDEPRQEVDQDGSYLCDHCGEEIVIPLDVAAGQDQEYVEDCPVCCSPSVIHVRVEDGRVDVWAVAE